MEKVTTWETKCRKCNSPVIHYSTTVDLDISGSTQEIKRNILCKDPTLSRKRRNNEDKSKLKTSIVHCVCSGENDQGKHDLTYKFPDEFQQVNK